jgi:hypothetical protein
MNDEQLQACWNELKHSSGEAPSLNPQLERTMMKELTTYGPRRRFWKRTLTTAVCLVGLCILGGVIADNIVMATPIEQADGSQEVRSESLLNYLMRHVHDHAHQLHKHFHGE